ncbi:hypothetical protein [Aphanothece minutissima]|uniref:Translation initiation factor IF-2 n=1 Tax=Aphanothece cf. minutissima CCALA 015 TaxID=2107695 RepID=A0ABX5FBH5_9CHRO|nr:hypothetical protein [Aphanothece minutissima]PSB38288.1 hypothetical protein C7B81_06210 [Aphanothece cf. minutissima CCALA 015]
MAHPRPPLSLAGPLLTLSLLLSACGGTSFGDALSRSFSRAPATPAAPAAPARTTAPAPPASSPAAPTPAAARQPPASGATPPPRPAAGATGATGATPAPPLAPAVRPAPYRVTIRLPQADPSAPAEVVTKALRAAGVPFEVETIERMPPAGSGAAETPAGAANGTAPATSRPAPAPR